MMRFVGALGVVAVSAMGCSDARVLALVSQPMISLKSLSPSRSLRSRKAVATSLMLPLGLPPLLVISMK